MTSPAETAPADAVRFEHVGLTLGENRILDDVCAHVPRGKFTAIVGPNGAGKTTLTLAILGQIRHTGKVLFPGLDEAGRKPRFGFVPQRLVFDRDIPMTVMDYLLSGLQRMPLFLGHSKRHVERIMQYLDEVECTRLADHAFGALSGGEIQRVLLAQALLQEPDILILDEPTSGVDFKGGQICCELLRRVREKRGFTQIMISHDLATVTAHADHVICLNHTVFGEGEPRVALTHQVLSETFGLHLGLPDLHGIPQDVRECPENCPLRNEHLHLHDHCHVDGAAHGCSCGRDHAHAHDHNHDHETEVGHAE